MSSFVYNPNANKAPFGSAGTRDVKVDRIEEGRAGDSTTSNVLQKASYTTSLTGSNNDLVFTAGMDGPTGNLITITYVDPGGTTATLGVVVSNSYDITVNLGRASSAINSTGALIAAAVRAATKLVTVANAAGNDGTGLVTAMSKQTLSGYGALASLTTNLSNATNNDLVWTAKDSNSGNDISVTYINPARASAALSVTNIGSNIVVGLATDGSSNVTTIASDIVTAVAAAPTVAALVTVANAASNNGSGLVAALPQTYLTGYGVITRATFDSGLAAGAEVARQSAVVDTSGERITQTDAVQRSFSGWTNLT